MLSHMPCCNHPLSGALCSLCDPLLINQPLCVQNIAMSYVNCYSELVKFKEEGVICHHFCQECR